MPYAFTFQGLDPYGIVPMYVDEAAGITAGSFVVLETNGVGVAADSCTTGIFGVAMETAVDNAKISIATQGVFKMDLASGFDPDIGDVVYVATVATVDAGTGSDVSVGIVVYPDPASAATANCLLQCAQLVATVHA